MDPLIEMLFLTMLAFVVIGVLKFRNLFTVVVLGAVYSCLIAGLMFILDAVDVAMTEVAVGTGISTVLMLSVLYLTGVTEEKATVQKSFFPLFITLCVGVLLQSVWDLPAFGGHAEEAIHQHVAPHYLANSLQETGIPNVVTAVLASYRGFDTLGETTVILTAGIAVLMLLANPARVPAKDVKDSSESQT